MARGYSDKRIASFVGVVPAEAPRLVIAVIVDEPQTDQFGGLSAAPAFREIAEGAMAYLDVPPSTGAAAAASPPRAVASAVPPAPSPAPAEASTSPAGQGPEAEGSRAVSVPDLKDRVGREAVSRLLAVSLEPRLHGSGRVVAQSPGPGSRVERGSQVTVELQPRP